MSNTHYVICYDAGQSIIVSATCVHEAVYKFAVLTDEWSDQLASTYCICVTGSECVEAYNSIAKHTIRGIYIIGAIVYSDDHDWSLV